MLRLKNYIQINTQFYNVKSNKNPQNNHIIRCHWFYFLLPLFCSRSLIETLLLVKSLTFFYIFSAFFLLFSFLIFMSNFYSFLNFMNILNWKIILFLYYKSWNTRQLATKSNINKKIYTRNTANNRSATHWFAQLFFKSSYIGPILLSFQKKGDFSFLFRSFLFTVSFQFSVFVRPKVVLDKNLCKC